MVGSFVVSKETSEAIGEALTILCSWNPSWSPSHWMTDNCRAEIQAIENTFSGKTNEEINLPPAVLETSRTRYLGIACTKPT